MGPSAGLARRALRTRGVVALAALLAALLLAPAAARAAPVPRSFFGVMADGPLLAGGQDLGAQAGAMRTAHVGTIRLAVYWSDAQPTGPSATDLSATDAVVLAAAAHGLDVLPVVLRTPTWAAAQPGVVGSQPRDPADYGRFLALLVARYGPRGSLWAEHPEVPARPVRRWQLWNEPDIAKYLAVKAWPAAYVRILRAGRRAVKAADPGATVVAAGLTNRSWVDLGKLYAAGARGLFDVAAIHPFSRRPANVVKIVGLSRATMAAHGDARKRLLISEISWSSGKGHSTFNYGWETTEAGQAQRIEQILPALARLRTRDRLAGVFWYTWLSPAIGGPDSFDYGGLRRLTAAGTAVDKPALGAFRRTVGMLVGATDR